MMDLHKQIDSEHDRVGTNVDTQDLTIQDLQESLEGEEWDDHWAHGR